MIGLKILSFCMSIYFNAWPHPARFEEDRAKEGIRAFLEGYFQRKIDPVLYLLKGGHSGSKNYLVEVDGAPYVVRAQNPTQPIDENRKELLIFIEAAKAGIAPKIYAVSPDFSYSLIEYIGIPTLSLESAKNALPSCAKALSLLHSLQIPDALPITESLSAQFVNIYEDLKTRHIRIPELEMVIEEIEKADNEMAKNHAPRAFVHGDLHPRNLFLRDGTALIVDWEGAGWDDPFHDLSYFSNIVGLEKEDERRFLKHYLQREPSGEEEQRYFLSKKSTLLFLAFHCFAQGYESAKENGEILKKDAPILDGSHYRRGWSEKGEHSAQFFYDWGKQLINQSKKFS